MDTSGDDKKSLALVKVTKEFRGQALESHRPVLPTSALCELGDATATCDYTVPGSQ